MILEAKVQRQVDGKIQILVVPMAWIPCCKDFGLDQLKVTNAPESVWSSGFWIMDLDLAKLLIKLGVRTFYSAPPQLLPASSIEASIR